MHFNVVGSYSIPATSCGADNSTACSIGAVVRRSTVLSIIHVYLLMQITSNIYYLNSYIVQLEPGKRFSVQCPGEGDEAFASGRAAGVAAGVAATQGACDEKVIIFRPLPPFFLPHYLHHRTDI